VDLVANTAADRDVSKKNLVFWPVLFLLAGLAWAQNDGTPLPTPGPLPSIAPTAQVQPSLTPTVVAPTATPPAHPQSPSKQPVVSAPPGMVYDAQHNVYRYQSRQHP
jgi:hypothetical protein